MADSTGAGEPDFSGALAECSEDIWHFCGHRGACFSSLFNWKNNGKNSVHRVMSKMDTTNMVPFEPEKQELIRWGIVLKYIPSRTSYCDDSFPQSDG